MRVLVVTAPYYEEITEALLASAKKALLAAKCKVEVVSVAGALEIPQAIMLAWHTAKYDGFVALGCVVRGETAHFDYVCAESARGLMTLSVDQGALIGNGILTVNTLAQAKKRMHTKGKEAADALLSLFALKKKWKL